MSHTRLICVSYMNHLRFVNECFVLCVFQRVHLWKRWGRVGVHDLLYALHLHNHITTPTHRIWVSLRAPRLHTGYGCLCVQEGNEWVWYLSHCLTHYIYIYTYTYVLPHTGWLYMSGGGGLWYDIVYECIGSHIQVSYLSTGPILQGSALIPHKKSIFVTDLWHPQSQKKKVIIVYFTVSGLTQRSGKLRIVRETS